MFNNLRPKDFVIAARDSFSLNCRIVQDERRIPADIKTILGIQEYLQSRRSSFRNESAMGTLYEAFDDFDIDLDFDDDEILDYADTLADYFDALVNEGVDPAVDGWEISTAMSANLLQLFSKETEEIPRLSSDWEPPKAYGLRNCEPRIEKKAEAKSFASYRKNVALRRTMKDEKGNMVDLTYFPGSPRRTEQQEQLMREIVSESKESKIAESKKELYDNDSDSEESFGFDDDTEPDDAVRERVLLSPNLRNLLGKYEERQAALEARGKLSATVREPVEEWKAPTKAGLDNSDRIAAASDVALDRGFRLYRVAPSKPIVTRTSPKQSPKHSPRQSPKHSPRQSPRASPRRSPSASPPRAMPPKGISPVASPRPMSPREVARDMTTASPEESQAEAKTEDNDAENDEDDEEDSEGM
jgi:hypothetical protein